jgi:hypothetical protein
MALETNADLHQCAKEPASILGRSSEVVLGSEQFQTFRSQLRVQSTYGAKIIMTTTVRDMQEGDPVLPGTGRCVSYEAIEVG